RKPAVDRARAAIRGVREVGQARVDDPRALLSGFGQRREAGVEVRSASPRRLFQRSPVPIEGAVERRLVAVESGAQIGTMSFEQLRHLLGVLADAPLELATVGVEALAHLLQ